MQHMRVCIPVTGRSGDILNYKKCNENISSSFVEMQSIQHSVQFDLSMCNPPFHASEAEAHAANQRKRNNLAKRKAVTSGRPRNFGGQKTELWCADGEIGFLTRMANESVEYSGQVNWFTSLVSKGSNIPPLKKLLSRLGAQKIDVLKMNQGQKSSRVLVWSFLTDYQ